MLLRSVDRSFILTSFFLVLISILGSSCHGAQLVVGGKLEDGKLSGRLHVSGKYLVFWCQVVPDSAPHGDIREARTALGQTFVSLGHSPSLIIYNSTWRETFLFDQSTWDKEEGEWRLVLLRSRFSFSDDSCEQWVATVQLDINTNLLGRVSTLLDFHRVPILRATFGPTLRDSADTRSEIGMFESCHLDQSACSPDVLVAFCQAANNDIFFGVTYAAFDIGSTRWTKVDLCSDLHGCENFTIFDVVLSTSHIIVLSSSGLILADFTDVSAQVEFVRVESSVVPQLEWTLSNTPRCSASNKASHWTEDIVFLSPKPDSGNSSQPVACFWSVPPYDQWKPFSRVESHGMVQLTAYDQHRRILLSLFRHENQFSEDSKPYVFRVLQNCSAGSCDSDPVPSKIGESVSPTPLASITRLTNLLISTGEFRGSWKRADTSLLNKPSLPPELSNLNFRPELFLEVRPVSVLTTTMTTTTLVPPARLLKEFQATGYCFHPRTNYLYLYGNQIWMSSDGGATFRCLSVLGFRESVVSCHPSRDAWIVFLTSTGSILYTCAGHMRILPLAPITSSSTLLVDALGQLLEVTRSQHWLSTRIVNSENGLKELQIPFRGVLSVLPISPMEVILIEPSGYQLQSMEGALLKHKRSGSTLLIKCLLTPSLEEILVTTTRAQAVLKDPLGVEHKPLCSLEITNVSGRLCNLKLQCSDNSTEGWSLKDTGKTIHTPEGSPLLSPLLLLTVHNTSDALGLAMAPAITPEESRPALAHSRWVLLDTSSYPQPVIPAEILTVDKAEWEAVLSPESEFEFLPSHEGMVIITSGGEALVAEVVTKRLIAISLEVGDIDGTLLPGEWTLVNRSQDPLWYYQEDACRHALHLDGAARRHAVRYLDLGSSLTFKAMASSMGDLTSAHEKLMRVTLNNPDVVTLVARTHHDQYGSEVMEITVTHSMYGKGTAALTVSIPRASLRCTDTSFTLTFHAMCPPSKHLHFIYDPLFTDETFLHGDPVDKLNRPLLKDFETNYRPPSTLGKDIPTSDNIYNADPSASRPREKYDISKVTGHFKHCAGKTSREECGCTIEQRLSSLAVNSDCRERVHRLIHAGRVMLRFIIREAGALDVTVQEPVALTLTEINDRIDYLVSAPSTPSLDLLEPLDIEGSPLWNSTAIQITLTGSGLYHFKAKVAAGFSYCDLEDEFQYYVDLAPLVNPTPTIVISAVSLVMGGAFFIWYLQYLNLHPQPPRRLDGTQCAVGEFH